MRFEKIIFCVDIGQEAGCEFVGPPTITRLECAKLLMKRYIFQKSRFNPKHEFGLCTVTDLTLWSQECTSDVERLNNSIDLLEYENRQIPMWDMSTLFSAIHDLQPDAKSMHTLRVILIYCRSNVIPMSPDPEQLAAFQRNPHCFLDARRRQ
ncbi:hypothetical protein DFJ77DRAFT_347186 [Powellomyces hirtus]|nr:hypothetical protein DFJ77DRAFT_347186 [Powellomyces hirtus]